ncbi:MAG: carbonic anhydrase family protein [Sulfuritalea sp.]|nr:carbonic anhydrase family protein [Sulfuritalea sp.]
MSVMRVACTVGLLALAVAGQGASAGGNWQGILVGRSETIEIDRTRIEPASAGATAWSRVKLDRPVNDPGGVYDAIHAQNLYDCAARRFTTLRRVYFNGDSRVREDVVARRRANAVAVGSIDERLFNVACGAKLAAAPAAQDAESAPAAVETAKVTPVERPAAMHADMRSMAAETGARRLTPVADTVPVPAADKPKLIVLPLIDKAAAAEAAAQAAKAGVAGGQKPAAAKPAAATALVIPRDVDSAAARRQRELHYATSGPRKAVRKKPAADRVPTAPAAPRRIEWAYEGEGGPSHWARLRSDYAACGSGKRQSPIDIRDGIAVNLESIKFDYRLAQFRIVDSGHTVQVKLAPGQGLTVMGKRYELQQLQFHRPAEERINGRGYDMSAHLVHRSEDGQIAIVVVLLEKGAEHPLIQTLWNNLPLEQGVEFAAEDAIDANGLLSENRAYWTYMGSLTTPPCTEGVLWMVLKQPAQISAEQLAIFSRVFRGNARPLQAANGRLIKESR